MFLVFLVWERPGDPGEARGIQKIKKIEMCFGQKIDIFMLEVIRLYSIIGARQSSRLTI